MQNNWQNYCFVYLNLWVLGADGTALFELLNDVF